MNYRTIFTLFELEIKLTNKGLKNWASVVATVFSFIKKTKNDVEKGEEGLHFFKEI